MDALMVYDAFQTFGKSLDFSEPTCEVQVRLAQIRTTREIVVSMATRYTVSYRKWSEGNDNKPVIPLNIGQKIALQWMEIILSISNDVDEQVLLSWKISILGPRKMNTVLRRCEGKQMEPLKCEYLEEWNV
ncbi:hypothetical protein ANN_12840 [Periplaneta americana]|uniref:Per a allergen n=1 Tax=Periplaneta americana TaxID=6978 RepID=A0ABQ8TK85_PERAM|nr:hypothetical protein ANN_12840 [Periplaneta americana]